MSQLCSESEGFRESPGVMINELIDTIFFIHCHGLQIECVCSHDKRPYWLFETKGRFCIKIEFNS